MLKNNNKAIKLLLIIGCIIQLFLATAGCRKTDSAGIETAAPAPVDYATLSWPVFRGDKRLRGVADCTISAPLSLLWKFQAGKPIKSTCVLGDGKAFFGTIGGGIFAVDLATGLQAWHKPVKGDIEAGGLLLNDRLYFGTDEGFLLALDPANGQDKWKFETDNKIMGAANGMVQDGAVTIIIGSYDNNAYYLNGQTGELIWKFETGNYVNGTPALLDNQAVFGGCDALVRFINLKTGTEDSSFDAVAYVAGSVAADKDEVFIPNFESTLFCYSLSDKKEKWRFATETGEGFFASPAIGEQCVVACSKDGNAYGLDRATGKRLWTFTTQGAIDSSPVICQDKVVICSSDGRVYLLDLLSGQSLWTYEIGEAITASPAISHGLIYAGAEDGNLYAFGPKELALTAGPDKQ